LGRDIEKGTSTVEELPILEPLASEKTAVEGLDDTSVTMISADVTGISSANISGDISMSSTSKPAENITAISDTVNVDMSTSTAESDSGKSYENFLFTAEREGPAGSVIGEKTLAEKKSAIKTKDITKKDIVSEPIIISTPLSKSTAKPFSIVLPEPIDILKTVDKKKTETKTEVQVEAKVSPETRVSPETPVIDTTDILRPSSMERLKVSQPVQSFQPDVYSTNEKLDKLLKKINDDILSDRLERAKDMYRDALLLYRSMNDPDKVKCYEQFYATFKKLDEVLHQKSLSELLDKHLSESEKSHRPMAFDTAYNVSNDNLSDESRIDGNTDSEYSDEFLRVSSMTTLPIMLSNDPETTRVYELIEESYFNIDNSHQDLAMLKYFKALELYHKLSTYDKKRLYSSLYGLFKNLSATKK
jgi:hypothetical protein